LFTTGFQSYIGTVILQMDTALTSSNAGTIRFASSLDGPYALVMNTTGAITLTGAAGGTTPLSSLVSALTGSVAINGGSVSTIHSQSYMGPVTLNQTTVLSGSSVDFASITATLPGVNLTMSNLTSQVLGSLAITGNLVITTGSGGAPGAMSVGNDGGVSQKVGSALSVGGNSYFVADHRTSQVANLGNGNSFTGSVSLTNSNGGNWSNVSLNATSGSLNLGTVTVTGNLAALSVGNITQTGALSVGAGADIESSTGSVVLPNASNQFLGPLTLVASEANIVSGSPGMVLGNVTISSGNLVLDSTGGPITQTNSSVITTPLASNNSITATTSNAVNAAAANILLANAGNAISGTTNLDGANVSVGNSVDLNLGNVFSSGNLSITGTAAVSMDNAAVTGNMAITTTGGIVSLGQTIVSGNVTTQTAGGDISQTGPMVVTGTTQLNAGNGNIMLTNPANNFTGTLGLIGNVSTVATTGDLNLGVVNNRGSLSLSASGAMNLGSAFIANGNLNLSSVGDLNLGVASIGGNLSMTTSTGNIGLGASTISGNLNATTSGGTINLGVSSVGQNLNVQTAGGNITQSGALTIGGNSNFNAGTGSVTLTNASNNFAGNVSINANAGALDAVGTITLGNTAVAENLDLLSSAGSIAQAIGTTMTIGGTTNLNALAGNVSLAQSNNTFAQAITVNAVNATIDSSIALTMATSAVSGNLALSTSQGSIAQTGPLSVGGTTNFVATSGPIDLSNSLNSFAGKVSVQTPLALTLDTSGPLTIATADVLGATNLVAHGNVDLGTSKYLGTLNVTSGNGVIMQTGPIKVGSNTNLNAGSGEINLFNPGNSWSGTFLYKAGILLVNHPQILAAGTSAGSLNVRIQPTVQEVQTLTVSRVGPPSTALTLSSSASSGAGSVNAPTTASAGGSNPLISVAVERPPAAGQPGLISVSVSPALASSAKGFSFELDPKVIGQSNPSEVKAVQMDGTPLPKWIHYDSDTKSFVAQSVPDGALPLQIKVIAGSSDSVVVIQETAGNANN
jgi:hypothetical protein